MFARRLSLVLLVALAALTLPAAALSKEVVSTTCGRDRCRTTTDGISGIATQPGRVSAPRSGRFYTVSLRMEIDGKSTGWKVVYEARRRIVLAADARARAFLGTRWARLAPDVRPAYARAVRGLAPMREPPCLLQATTSVASR